MPTMAIEVSIGTENHTVSIGGISTDSLLSAMRSAEPILLRRKKPQKLRGKSETKKICEVTK